MYSLFNAGYNNIELILAIVAFLIAILFSMSLHEYAHAKVAYIQGDFTPKAKNRLTLNPFAHFDLIGFACLALVGFGWAKPVPINPLNFKEYRKGFFLVSIAGILTNLVLAFLFGGLNTLSNLWYINNLYAGSEFLIYLSFFVSHLCTFFMVINMSLCIFNLLPIYPLDGFNIISSFTKSENNFVKFMTKYGSLLLFVFILIDSILNLNLFSTVISYILYPIQSFWVSIIL